MTTSRLCVLTAALILLPRLAAAQNTTPATAVQIVAGQPAVRVTPSTVSDERYYSAGVVSGRSYCAEATASEAETNAADPSLTVFHENGIDTIGSNTGANEPRGQVADRVCFKATATETVYIQLSPTNASVENREYAMRFVETTLWANWFFVGGGYSSFTLIRNTTNAPIDVTNRAAVRQRYGGRNRHGDDCGQRNPRTRREANHGVRPAHAVRYDGGVGRDRSQRLAAGGRRLADHAVRGNRAVL